MISFSPCGCAIKSYYGLGARTFGNPDGALTGGGAYAAGGDNPDGPNQGGGPGGGFAFTIFASGPQPGPDSTSGAGFGYYDGATNGGISAGLINNNTFPVFFNSQQISGATFTDATGGGPTFGAPSTFNYCFILYGTLAQNFFTSATFPTTQFGGNHTYLTSAAFFTQQTLFGTPFTIWMWATTDDDTNCFGAGPGSTYNWTLN